MTFDLPASDIKRLSSLKLGAGSLITCNIRSFLRIAPIVSSSSSKTPDSVNDTLWLKEASRHGGSHATLGGKGFICLFHKLNNQLQKAQLLTPIAQYLVPIA